MQGNIEYVNIIAITRVRKFNAFLLWRNCYTCSVFNGLLFAGKADQTCLSWYYRKSKFDSLYSDYMLIYYLTLCILFNLLIYIIIYCLTTFMTSALV